MSKHNEDGRQPAGRPSWYTQLRDDAAFPGRRFTEQTIGQIERRAHGGEAGRHRARLRLAGILSGALIVCLAAWLAAGQLSGSGTGGADLPGSSLGPSVPPDGTAPVPTVSASHEPAGERTLAAIDGKYRLYVNRADEADEADGSYDQVYLEDTARNIVKSFNWHGNIRKLDSQLPASAQLVDLDQDGTAELVVILVRTDEAGMRTQEVHAVTTNGLHELPVQLPSAYLTHNTTSSVKYINGYIYIELTAGGHTYRKAVEATTTADVGDRLAYGTTQYSIATGPDRLTARVQVVTSGPAADSPRVAVGEMELSYAAADDGLTVDAWNFAPAQAAKEIPLYAIQIGGSFLPLQTWDDKLDLVGLLGQPKSEHQEQLGDGADTLTGSWTKKLVYDGLAVQLFSPKDNGKTFWIDDMTLTDDRYASSLGVRVGDTVAQLREAYPTIAIANDGRTDPDNCAYALEDESQTQRLTFEVASGKVKEIRIQYLIP
ncbi:hypothetical protein [Cohnella sp. 56]|uniref:hypothetical protein n=1 Tax=Cohnella sp. 56 TaxID=3113722 RepID=UPI0030EA1726